MEDGERRESDICEDFLFVWSASATENLCRLLSWTISSLTVEMKISSGMKVTGSPCASAAMTERPAAVCER